jgi:hypothetical protein
MSAMLPKSLKNPHFRLDTRVSGLFCLGFTRGSLVATRAEG